MSKDARKPKSAQKLIEEVSKPKKKFDFAKLAAKVRKEDIKEREKKLPAKIRRIQKRITAAVPSRKRFVKVRTGVESIITTAGIGKIPKKTKSRKGEGIQAGPGRPKGTYKFSIPGKGPVPVHVYKKWVARQKALARIKALAQVKAIQKSQTAPFTEEEIKGVPEVEEVEGMEMQMPTKESILAGVPPPQAPPQQIQQPGEARAQLDFRGQRNVLSPVGGNILQAPNVMRGELRNVGEVPVVRLGERPQANPQGELFTNIDPVTGRQIIQRRVSEKFMTGEAL